MSNSKKWFGFIGLIIVNFTAMFLIAGVGVYSFTVAELFNNVSSVGMIFALECLARSISVPLAGKLGDKLGQKKLFIFALIMYTLSYIGVAVSTSFWFFTIARMISGFAWGLFITNTFVLITAVFGQEQAPKYTGYNQALTTVAMIVASPVTGFFCSFNWRMEFYISAALLVIGLVLCIFCLPDIPSPEGSQSRIDMVGLLLMAVSLIAFTLVMNFGGTMGWGSPLILAGIAVSVIGVIALIIVEKKSKDPIIPLELFKNPYYVCILMITVLFSVANGAGSYAPTYAQYVLGTSSVISGFITTPGMIIAVFLTTYFGNLAAKTGKYKKMIMIWTIGTLAGGALWALLGGASTATAGLILLVAGAVFLAAVNSANQIVPYTYPMSILKPQELAGGLSFIGLAGTVGSTLAGGLCTALMNSPLGLVSVFWIPVVSAVLMLIFAVKFKDA